MSRREGIYEPLGVSGLGSTGLRILYRMVETLSVGRFLTWQSSMNPLFLRPVTALFTDETLTFSFRARLATCGLTRPVERSIRLSRSHKICSGKSYGRLGGLPLDLPVALCFMDCRLMNVLVFFLMNHSIDALSEQTESHTTSIPAGGERGERPGRQPWSSTSFG